jgi:hypothetical protein
MGSILNLFSYQITLLGETLLEVILHKYNEYFEQKMKTQSIPRTNSSKRLKEVYKYS